MFEKVMVCLNGSELAEQIMPYAMEEAVHFNSKIVLLQVFTPPIHGVVTGLGAAGQLQREVEEEGARIKGYLDGVAQPLREKGLDVECIVLEGDPGEEIVTYALEHEVSLVGISAHRRRGLTRTVFGHTADFVLKELNLPVLLVKPEVPHK